MKSTHEILTSIAREHLGFSTLETRRSDHLDFREVSVWSAQNALHTAFEAGRASRTTDSSLLSRYDAYEVQGVRFFWANGKPFFDHVDDSEAEVWRLYGHEPGGRLQCIGDFLSREDAEEIYARITGRRYAAESP